MKTLKDCFGHSVRLTEERLAHILERPEMKDMGEEIERVLRQPQLVRRSRSDDAVRLFYLTGKPKTGEDLWPKK
jgi:hypothetical protein